MASSLLDRYVEATLRYRWIVVAGSLLLMLAAGAGARLIGVTNDYLVLFRDDNPQLLAFQAMENRFSASDRALIAVAPREGSVFTREALGAVVELTDAAWGAPYSSRVDSLTNFNHSEAFGEDDLIVAPLVEDATSLSDADLAGIESIALDSVELVGRLVAGDGRAAGVVINFVLPENQDEAVVEINGYLDALLEEARANHPEIDYYVTGDVPMHRAFAQATAEDLETRTPLVFLIIVVLATLLLRSVLGTAAVVAVLTFAVGTTLGFAGWTGVVFSPASSGVAIIVMVIAVADSIHVVSTVLLELRRGRKRRAAIVEAFRVNTYPIFLTSVTTGIGFLSLNAADAPPFHDLGNYTALGVLCAFVYSMTLLPALLAILPMRANRAVGGPAAVLDRFAEFVVERRRVLLWSVAAGAVILAAGVPLVELNDNPRQYFDEGYEFRRHSDYVAANLTSLDTLEYTLDAGREGGITDPEYLERVGAFAEWFREQPEVTHVQVFSDIMRRLNRNMNGDDPAFDRLPDDGDLAAQYLLLYELSLPFGSDLNNRIDIAKSATRMVVAADSPWYRELRELDARAQSWLDANAPGLAGEASGLSVMFAHVSQRSIDSMLGSTIAAMALISFLLIFVFRSVRLGLLSLVPNFLPAIMSFGVWGYLVGNVGIAASVMVAIVFGIIVDDTIHFLCEYQKSRREGRAPADAVRSTFRTVGQALLTTTVVLAAGFTAFATSGFQISWSLGLLVAITVVLALAADFLLLPPLLMATDARSRRT
ncbi:MAG: MMPL family transporter [Acidobacteria bacterium]|nr:MMPL family transporter [Acidobacteriota bacterium]